MTFIWRQNFPLENALFVYEQKVPAFVLDWVFYNTAITQG